LGKISEIIRLFGASRKHLPLGTPMLTSDQAREIAVKYILEKYGEEAVSEWVGEQECLLLFIPRSRKYLETRDPKYLWFGPGLRILDKRTAAIYEYGSSRHESERAVLDFNEDGRESSGKNEIDFLCSEENADTVRRLFPLFDRFKLYDIFIHQIHDELQLVKILFSLTLNYIVPKRDGRRIWRIPKSYTKELIEQRVRSVPPIVFSKLNSRKIFTFLGEIERETICEFDIKEHILQFHKTLSQEAPEEDYKLEW
jgi:hypothetical protein